MGHRQAQNRAVARKVGRQARQAAAQGAVPKVRAQGWRRARVSGCHYRERRGRARWMAERGENRWGRSDAPRLTKDLPTGVVECEPRGGNNIGKLRTSQCNGIVNAKGTRPNITTVKSNVTKSADADSPKLKGSVKCGEGLFMGPRTSKGWRRRTGMAARWARAGVRLKFKRRWGPRARVRGWHVPNRIPQDLELKKEKQIERDRQIGTGSFKPCETQDPKELVKRGCKISPAFMIRQKKKNRLIIDMRRLNAECEEKTMKLEQLKLVSRIAKRNWWFQSRDIKDGYGHVGIHKDHWKFMVADMGELLPGDLGPRFVYCCALPFGYQCAPWAFTKFMRVIVADLRAGAPAVYAKGRLLKRAKNGHPALYARGKLLRRGRKPVTLLVYLDDLLIASPTRAQSVIDGAVVDQVVRHYGLTCHESKGVHVPTQVIEHLGTVVDSKRGLFLLSPERQGRIIKMAKQILGASAHNKRRIHAKWLAQFAGLCISAHLAVPAARFYTRALFDCLRDAGVYAENKWHLRAVLTKPAVRCLRWWAALGGRAVGRAVWRPPITQTVATDASKKQWGAVLNKGPLPPKGATDEWWRGVSAEHTVPAWGFWNEWEARQHITFLELRSFRYFLMALGHKVAKSVLLLWEDNQGVVGILNNYVSKSPQMMGELELTMALIAKLDIDLRVRYCRSAENPSDWWTRFSDKAEWRLSRNEAHRVMHTWGECTIDRFAVTENAQLVRFDAPYECLGAEWVDTFSRTWEGERSWINPPLNKVAQVLDKLGNEPGAEAAVLLPVWRSAHWWPLLQELCDDSVDVRVDASTVTAGVHCRGAPEPLRRKQGGWLFKVYHIPARTAG